MRHRLQHVDDPRTILRIGMDYAGYATHGLRSVKTGFGIAKGTE
jgi:hypothetical protein